MHGDSAVVLERGDKDGRIFQSAQMHYQDIFVKNGIVSLILAP